MIHALYKIRGLTASEVEGLISRETLTATNREVRVQRRLFDDKYDVELVEDDRFDDPEVAPIRATVIAKYTQLSIFRGTDA